MESIEDLAAPLGMESGQIKDYQLSASSSNIVNEEALKGRLNYAGQWCSITDPSYENYIRVGRTVFHRF